METVEMYAIQKRSNDDENIHVSVILTSTIRIGYIAKSKSYSSLHH